MRYGKHAMNHLHLRTYVIWIVILAIFAMARIHFRSTTTEIAYDLGQLKNIEGKLLEERSLLKGEIAKATTKKSLESLSARADTNANNGDFRQ
jgi:hypothetical protein